MRLRKRKPSSPKLVHSTKKCSHLHAHRPDSSITERTDFNLASGWDPSNYVLIANVQDDSIWILWKKFILSHETAEYEQAKDVWPGPYAVFPGMPVYESVICAKLANSWDDLNPNANLRLTKIARAPSARNKIKEPMLVSAMRTPQGGVRRHNDYRSMGPRSFIIGGRLATKILDKERVSRIRVATSGTTDG